MRSGLKNSFLFYESEKTDNINRILITLNELFYYYFCQSGRDFAKLITLTE